jgi:hypothetical protein
LSARGLVCWSLMAASDCLKSSMKKAPPMGRALGFDR